MSETARQKLMMMLYDPERDGYESGSESDFPVEERAIAAIQSLQQENEVLKARDEDWGICTDCGSCRYYPPQGDGDE